MAICSRSSIDNIKNSKVWIWKNKCIITLMINQPDIDQIYLYAKAPYETNYKYLISKYSNHMEDVYKNIQKYNVGKKC